MEDLKNTLKESLEYYKEQEKQISARISTLPKGNIKKKVINNNTYYYLQYRKSKKVVDKYIGKIIPDKLKYEINERKKLENQLKQIRKAIKLLNKNPEKQIDLITPVKNIFKKFTELNLWQEGMEIIGSWCFILYQKYLPIEQYPLKTEDLDILIKLPYKGKVFDLSKYFKELGFKENFNPDGSMYFTSPELKVEFISEEKGKGRKKAPFINELSISTQTLRFMNILTKKSILLSISRSIKVCLPSPSSFVLHKLILSTRTNRKNKKEKDIKQALYTAKYVIGNRKEKNKMLTQWKSFPKSWKNKIMNAIKTSEKLFPSEESIIKILKEIL